MNNMAITYSILVLLDFYLNAQINPKNLVILYAHKYVPYEENLRIISKRKE